MATERALLSILRRKKVSGGMKILVVDDEPFVRSYVESVLHKDGHEVETAESGEEALTKFDSQRFDLVFTDCSMPGMNGDELAHTIRARPQPAPVIMLTGSPPKRTPQDVARVVLKPFDAEMLRGIIWEFVR